MGDTMNESQNQQIQLLNRLHRWRLAFFGTIILIAGIIIGAAATTIISTASVTEIPKGIEHVNKRSLEKLKRQLQLSPEQSEQITVIFNDHMKALNAIREKAKPQIASQMNSLYTEVREILDDKQQQIWEKSIHRLRDDFKRGPKRIRQRGRRGREHGGPGRDRQPPEHRPFNMWEGQPEEGRPMRRHRGPGPGRGPGGGMRGEPDGGPGMGPGPEGFEPPPEDQEPPSNENEPGK